jgi:pentatricopeptide repeat protein
MMKRVFHRPFLFSFTVARSYSQQEGPVPTKKERKLSLSKEYEYKVIANLNFNKDLVALSFMKEAMRNNVKITKKAYICLFEKLKPKVKHYSQELNQILQHLENTPLDKVDDRFYRAVLRIYSEMGNIEMTERWLRKIECHKDTLCLNTLLQAYSRNKMFTEAYELLSTMKSKYGQEPDIFSFTIVANSCTELEQLDQVNLLMREYNILPNAIYSQRVIYILIDNGLIEDALKIYEDMKKIVSNNIILCDTISYLIPAFQNNEKQIQSFLKDLEEKNIKPNRRLAFILVQYSSTYRENLIKQLIIERYDTIMTINKEYPNLFSTLLSTLEAVKDPRSKKVKTWLTNLEIIKS